jgi:hypothetical protein
MFSHFIAYEEYLPPLLLESIVELLTLVVVMSCPVGAHGADGIGGPSDPGALPRAIAWHTVGVLMPKCGSSCMNHEENTAQLVISLSALLASSAGSWTEILSRWLLVRGAERFSGNPSP